ncbi:MAG: isocitrate lyase/phosphoenolpyruvate mutase family protein [Sphingomonas sp.]
MTIDKYRAFAALHEPGRPVILYNAWDAGSARAVARAGAKAIATGSWSVAAAQGYDDGEALPIEIALANATRIVGAVALPVTIDFEGGYADEPTTLAENVASLARVGAIGCNLEDRIVGGEGLHSIDVQAERVAAARRGAGEHFFINARTDIFLETSPDTHDDAKLDEAIERAAAYAKAGASGFFVPGLVDLALLERLCGTVTLPVNFMAFPGAPGTRDVAGVGIARVSYGPNPFRAAMAALTAEAQAAFAWDSPPAMPTRPAPLPRRGARTRTRPLQTV